MSAPSTNSRPFVVVPPGLRIGRYTIDKGKSALVHAEGFLRLRPQVFAVVEALAGGEALSREQLAEIAWGTPVEHSQLGNPLDQIISDVRRALAAMPDLSVVREAKGYRLHAADTGASGSVVACGQALPVSFLMNPAQLLGGCDLARKRFLFSVSQPLELRGPFAAATMSHLEAHARIQILLPESRYLSCASLLTELICVGLPDGEAGRDTAKRRIAAIAANLRIVLVDSPLLPRQHWHVYRYDEEHDAVAMVLSSNAEQAFVQAVGRDAFAIASELRAVLRPGRSNLLIDIDPAREESIRAELATAIAEDFPEDQVSRYLLAAEVLKSKK